MITGGSMEKLTRTSPVISDDNREFLREVGWRV